MAPKIEGEWDIHFIDQYLALLEARYSLKRPISSTQFSKPHRASTMSRRSPPLRPECTG